MEPANAKEGLRGQVLFLAGGPAGSGLVSCAPPLSSPGLLVVKAFNPPAHGGIVESKMIPDLPEAEARHDLAGRRQPAGLAQGFGLRVKSRLDPSPPGSVPRIAGGSSLLEDECKAPEEIVPVMIVTSRKRSRRSIPPRDDMVEGTSGIDTGGAGHAELIGWKLKI